jgi:hypothetical protein
MIRWPIDAIKSSTIDLEIIDESLRLNGLATDRFAIKLSTLSTLDPRVATQRKMKQKPHVN